MHYEYWRHRRSGEVYAVRLSEDWLNVTGACGPLHYTDWRDEDERILVERLPDYHYGDDPDLAETIDNDAESYVPNMPEES